MRVGKYHAYQPKMRSYTELFLVEATILVSVGNYNRSIIICIYHLSVKSENKNLQWYHLILNLA